MFIKLIKKYICCFNCKVEARNKIIYEQIRYKDDDEI